MSYENEYLLTRCSICFDAKYEFCLNECKDQFCTGCFEKYVTELVRNSWGMAVQDIKCPACLIHLPDETWTKHVSSELSHRYKECRRPFRQLTRFCVCGEPVHLASPPPPIISNFPDERLRLLQDIFFKVEKLLDGQEQELLERFQESYFILIEEGNTTGMLPVYRWLMPALREVIQRSALNRPYTLEKKFSTLTSISSGLNALEYDPEDWKELQFLHIAHFPLAKCGSCKRELCFSCGESPFHDKKTCQESLSFRISKSEPGELRSNLKWQLENSKRCPKCSIVISRDEGCNKMDCLYCGYKFCWSCLGEFVKGACGFYTCTHPAVPEEDESEGDADIKNSGESSEAPQAESDTNALTVPTRPKRADSGIASSSLAGSPPETGVPDVNKITHRFQEARSSFGNIGHVGSPSLMADRTNHVMGSPLIESGSFVAAPIPPNPPPAPTD